MRFQSGRHSGAVTPYKWQIVKAGGWRIGYGLSGLLIAEGGGWSRPKGMQMYRRLEADYWKRKA